MNRRPNTIEKRTRSPRTRIHGFSNGVPPTRKHHGRRRGWTCEVGRVNIRKAISLRRQGMTYKQIASRLGVSEGWAWQLVHRASAEASPAALKIALTQCEEMVRQLASSDLATILALQTRLRALVTRQGQGGAPTDP